MNPASECVTTHLVTDNVPLHILWLIIVNVTEYRTYKTLCIW